MSKLPPEYDALLDNPFFRAFMAPSAKAAMKRAGVRVMIDKNTGKKVVDLEEAARAIGISVDELREFAGRHVQELPDDDLAREQ